MGIMLTTEGKKEKTKNVFTKPAKICLLTAAENKHAVKASSILLMSCCFEVIIFAEISDIQSGLVNARNRSV